MNTLYAILLTLWVVLACVFPGSSQSEESVFSPGSHTFLLGIGVINPTSTLFDIAGLEETFSGDPSVAINLQYEYSLNKGLGIGVYVDYYRVNGDIIIPANIDFITDPLCAVQCITGINVSNCDCGNVDFTERTSVYTFAGRLGYHFPIIENLDTYTSIIAGYSINRRASIAAELAQQVLRELNIGDNLPDFIYKVNLGSKYHINQHWGFFGEIGWSNTHLIRFGGALRL